MDFVAVDLRSDLDDRSDFDPCLESVVSADETDVSASYNEDLLSRFYEVAVDKRLESACAVNAGKVVAFEEDRLFPCAARKDEPFEIDCDIVFIFDEKTSLFVLENADNACFGVDFDVFEASDFLFEDAGDVYAACSGEAVFLASEEFVGLEQQFAAEFRLVVNQNDAETELCKFDRRVEAAWSAADNENVAAFVASFGVFYRSVVFSKFRNAVKSLDLHSCFERSDARFLRQSVDDHRALAALAVRAEDTQRSLAVSVERKLSDTVCEKG